MLGPNKKKKKQKRHKWEVCLFCQLPSRALWNRVQNPMVWNDNIWNTKEFLEEEKSVASSYVRKMHIESDPHTEVHKKKETETILKTCPIFIKNESKRHLRKSHDKTRLKFFYLASICPLHWRETKPNRAHITLKQLNKNKIIPNKCANNCDDERFFCRMTTVHETKVRRHFLNTRSKNLFEMRERSWTKARKKYN